jgi:hypothetical protein
MTTQLTRAQAAERAVTLVTAALTSGSIKLLGPQGGDTIKDTVANLAKADAEYLSILINGITQSIKAPNAA